MAHDDQDVIQLLHDTDGWPIAVDWIVREAASTSRSLRGAFEAWRGMHGHLLATFVESECANDPEAQARFRAFFANVEGAGPRELAELEALGFPVVRTRSGLRPYRIIAALAAPEADDLPYAVRPPAYLTMNVLGRFSCKIDGRSIAFQRRRDQNVFTYVALAPDCRATRMQLLEAFWPGTVRTVAAQHLRTTISRIRRALAEAVGADCVERYFQSTGDICIDPSFLVLDARRFVEHVEHGRIEDARGASAVAKHHYAAAERLYRGRLLASEPVEPCFHKSLEQLEAAYSEALSRLVNISVTRNEVADAKDYGARLLARAADTEERRSAMRLLVNEMVLA